MDGILKGIFMNEEFHIWVEFRWSLFIRVQLTISNNIDSGNGLAPKRWQAIAWTNFDPVHWRIYATPRGDELKFPMQCVYIS